MVKLFTDLSIYLSLVVVSMTSPVQVQQVVPTVSPTDPGLHEKLGLPKSADTRLPTLFLVGDSTVRNGHGDGANGALGDFF